MPKIAAGATNKNISLAPNGAGKVVVGTGAADATVQSDGDHNLILQTGNSTTSKIEINDGANGDVAITPNGTGNLTIDNIAISDNAITSTDTNGNIDLTPNGTGEVNISKVDIDSGAIDGTTIATSDVTVGSGKTLDVSAGTLTSSTAQKQAIVDGADIEGTAVDSTGESGATKFLRENGDGTCSWQTASGSDSLPSQTGNADKLLTTNGSAASWTNAPINLIKLAFAGQSSAPGAPSAGTVYYDTTTNSLKVYNGTSWELMNELATGGIVTSYTDGVSYRSHTFLTSGTFLVLEDITADIMMVGGGGGGSGSGDSYTGGAGGGGGGVYEITGSSAGILSAGVHAIVIGGGGGGATGYSSAGTTGEASTFVWDSSNTYSATGGGGAGSYGSAPLTTGASGGGAGNGGAGGNTGGTGTYKSDSGLPTGHLTYGNNGGNSVAYGSSVENGGGGGGAGSDGTNSSSGSVGGNGGTGRDNAWRTGSNLIYGAGGGGCGSTTAGYGGNNVTDNGAGNGGSGAAGANGLVNQGGGGGGASTGLSGGNRSGGTGGSGIVIIRYAI